MNKLSFDTNAMLDTLVRYKEKGSYASKGDNNAENKIKEILEKNNILFDKGDLPKLKTLNSNNKGLGQACRLF